MFRAKQVKVANSTKRTRWRLASVFLAGLVPVLASATVTVVNKFSPEVIYVGDTSTYTLTVKNSSNAPLTSVNLTSLLGSNVQVESILSDTCNFATKTVATAAPYGVVLAGGATPAQSGSIPGECVVTIQVKSTVSGNHPAEIPADTSPSATQSGFSALENGALVQNSTLTNVTLGVNNLPAPTGRKEFPSTAYEGAPFPLKITLSNNSNQRDLQLTELVDNLPAGMTVASPANVQVLACNGSPAITANPDASVITLTGGSIPVSGSCQFSVDVVVKTLTDGAAANFTNTIGSGAIGNNRELKSSEFSSTVNVKPALALNKSFSATVVPVGAPTRMKITITNNGVVPLTSTTLTDTFPAGMQLAPVPNATVLCSDGATGTLTGNAAGSTVLSLSGAQVPAATLNPVTPGTCTIEADVVMTSEGELTNTLPAKSVGSDQGVSSPEASATLQAYAQLRVNKTVAPANVASGQWAQYTIAIQNYSPTVVTGAVLQDQLPSPMVLDYSAVPTSSCGFAFTASGTANVEGGNQLQGTAGSLPAASGINPGVCTVTFRARLPVGTPNGVHTNTLPVGAVSDGNGTGGIHNTNTVGSGMTVVDAVELRKSFRGSTTSAGLQAVAQGQSATLRIDIINRFVNPLTGVNLTDNLERIAPGLTLAADPQPLNTCGGTLDARPYGTALKLTGATAPARSGTNQEASCYIEVKVVGKLPGTFENKIDAAQDFSSDSGAQPKDTAAKLVVFAGLSAKKSFSPTAVQPGAVSRATISITNGTNAQLTNVSMVDDGLVGLTVANPANAATTCSGTTSLTANPGTTAVHLAGAVIPAGATCDVSFDVLASGSGTWSNAIPANGITSSEGSYNSEATSATLIKQTAELSLNKSFSETFVQGNAPTVLRLTLSNNSNVEIKGVAVADNFPAGMLVYSVPGISTTCTGATVAATPGDGRVVVTGANLPSGSSCTVMVTVTSSKYLNLTNTIPAGAISSQGGYTNKDPAIATVSTLEGLGVSKGFTPATIQPGGISRLQITLTNTFSPISTPLTGASFTDNLPTGLRVADNPNITHTCTGDNVAVTAGAGAGLVTLTNATLSPNQSCTIAVDVTADDKNSYTNEIGKGTVTTNEKVTNEVPGISILDVDEGPGVSKNFSPSTVSVGMKSKLTVQVKNNAKINLTGVSMADNLPAGMVVANPANSSTSCTNGLVNAKPGDERVTLTGATVVTGKTCEFWVDVLSTKSGVLKNTIAKDAIKSNEGLTNGNPTDAPLTVLTPPEVTKSFTPVMIDAGGTSQLVINLKNGNRTPVTLTKLFADALPANVFVQSPDNLNSAAKTPAGSPVACTTAQVSVADGGTRVTYANGAIIPAGGCSIWVDVTSSVAGSYLNKIEAGQLQTDAGFNPEPAVATIGVGAPAAPTIKKSFGENVINPGEPTTLTIELNNPNKDELSLTADLVDSFPADMTVANPTNLSTTCPAVPVVAAGDVQLVYPNGAKLPANGGCKISVDVTSTKVGTYNNLIPKGGLQTTGGSNPEDTSDGVTVVPPDDPTVLKSFSPKTINKGQISHLTITLGNSSARVATLTADMFDYLPAGISVAMPPKLGGTCMDFGSVEAGAEFSGGALTEHVKYAKDSKIPAMGGCTITIDVTSATADVYTNTIPKGGLATDLGINQAPATDKLTVLEGDAPSVMKLFEPKQIAPGEVAGLVIILNPGANLTSPVLQKDLVDTLPGDMVVVAGPLASMSDCDANFIEAPIGSRTVTYKAGGRIPAFAGCSIAVNVTAQTPGVLINTIVKGALETDVGSNPNPATDDIEVLPNAALASIAGKVYHDRNDDGLVTAPNDEGVGGVTVVLQKLTPSGLVTVATTTTKPDGTYHFPGLVPGSGYMVSVVHPAGWINGKDTPGSNKGDVTAIDEISNITLAAGNAAVEYNFGLRKPPTLSGKVYHDKNDDGAVDPKEEGVGEVEIKVTWTDKDGKAQSKTTKTDKDGNYTFTDLPPDTEFTVTKIHPPGWINGKDTAGTHGGMVTDDVIGEVTLTSGDEAKEYNYGLRKNASISGKVYHDKDDGGVLNDGDVGVGEVEIKLTWKDAAGQDQSKTVTTGPDGSYRFDDLEADLEYTVTKVHPKGWEDRMDNVGTHGGTANQDDVISTIKLSSGDQAEEYNFGLYKKEAEPTPVPTMGQWSLVLLSLMLGFAGLRQRRRG